MEFRREIMKITIEFNSIEEYLGFREKTAQGEQYIEQLIDIKLDVNLISNCLTNYGKVATI